LISSSSSAIGQAAVLDAAGDHDEAINVLAAATQAGDLYAMTRLGKRLLVGDRAPYLPKEGASMVLEAAYKNNAEAVATVAVFQCIGIYQQKSWPQAFNTLVHAASLGWRPAREQLLLLLSAPAPGDPHQLLEIQEPAFWNQLTRSVDIEAWFGIPAPTVLSDSPRVVSFANFIPASWCSFFIRLSAEKLKPALVYDAANKRNYRAQTRTNSIAEFNLMENDFIHFLMQERMSRACGVPMNHMEGTAILNYQPGEESSNHFDFVDPGMTNYAQEIAENGQRIITFLIYLNADYEGGTTDFPLLGLSNKGKLGEGLYFVNALPDGTADKRTLHAGSPPVSGQKWIVSQFIRNRPVKYVL
jgi:prolyl 4-hydroxylase